MMNVNVLKYELKIDVIDSKTDLKYQLKTAAIKLSLQKLSIIEISDLMVCVNQAVSFWVSPVIEDCQDIKDEERKKERLAVINKFRNYLTLNTLYQLIVKKEENVYIHNSWSPMENLFESVKDSEVPTLNLPVKTHMHVYRDKVILNDRTYYDSTQNDVENSDSMNLNGNRAITKSHKEYINLFSNRK